MKVKTKIFGEIEIDEEKVICFENGIVGFPELKDLHWFMTWKKRMEAQ